MKKERTGFIFLKTFNESIEDLEPQDKCIMYEAIINYGLYGTEPELTKGYLKSIWKLISSTIDVTSKKYDASVENGKKGGRPKKPTNNLTETQEKPKQNPTESLKENKIELNKIELNENKRKLKENNNYDEYMKSLEIDYDLDKIDFGKYNGL
jgi:hypothetical protein